MRTDLNRNLREYAHRPMTRLGNFKLTRLGSPSVSGLRRRERGCNRENAAPYPRYAWTYSLFSHLDCSLTQHRPRLDFSEPIPSSCLRYRPPLRRTCGRARAVPKRRVAQHLYQRHPEFHAGGAGPPSNLAALGALGGPVCFPAGQESNGRPKAGYGDCPTCAGSAKGGGLGRG